MSAKFNAGEVLEIARQIERNGRRFYRQAGEQVEGDVRLRETLFDLAAMEERHERIFAAMQEELSAAERPEPIFDPYEDTVQYLRAIAGGYVFDVRTDPVEWLAGERSVQEVLRKALGMEKDAIVFYLGIKDAVPQGLGVDKIDAIIREEMGHVTLLTNRLESLGG